MSTATEPLIDAEQLEVSRIRALRGPNYWRLAPVIACDVQLGSLENVSSVDIPGFYERLTEALPTLAEHHCTRQEPGGFLERLREGTHLPHILEHVALELQSLTGSDVTFGRVVPSGDPDTWWVIIAYEEEEVGLQSMRDAVKIVRACIADLEIDVGALIEQLQSLYEAVRLGPSTAAVVEEAKRRGIPVRRLNNYSLVQLGLGKNLRRIQATLSDYTSAIAVEIAQDKDDTKRVLGNIGLPVPKGDVARSFERALEIVEEVGYPVILKPLDASHGRGISGRIDNEEALKEAWNDAREYGNRIVIEQYSEGRDHRVLVVNGRVVACAERIPARVIGDGKSTIAQLIERENRDPRRGVGHTKTLTKLPADDRTVAFLARQKLTLASVPDENQEIYLRGTANLSTGGTSVDRTDEMHPDNITACEMAAGIIGLDIAGIDVLTPDISVPFRENGAVIIEVNAGPGIRMHTHPSEGTPRNVGAPVIDMLYPPGSDHTIPVIAVTGTNGKTTTTRLIAHLFRHTGKTVGFTTTDGVYLQNRLVMEGDMTGPFAANIVLSNPTVEVAVLETARGGILRAGLGFEEADVGVVLNVSADHLGLRGIHTVEQLADVKGVVAAIVKREGHAVLNADDPLVYGMRERTAADVVLLSTMAPGENDKVEDHIARNGIAARVEEDTFVLRRGRLRIPIAPVREVPLMLGGAAKFQRQNILAAIATAYVQGMRYDDIRAGLLSFFPSPSLTPGRLNLMRLGAGRVLVDYAHNPAAVGGLMELALELPALRRIGVLTVPGDRRDEDLREGQPGEIARIMSEGLVQGGMDPARISVVPDEGEAVEHAVRAMGDGDLTVVLVEDVPAILERLRTRAAPATV